MCPPQNSSYVNRVPFGTMNETISHKKIMKKIQRKIQKNNEKIQRKLKKEGEKKNPPGFTKSPSYNCLILKISFQKIKYS
jgi:hypothetical protein